jgi:hypothetical protein
LHGNFRDGQEHLYAGPARSTTVWYGFFPDPAHSPQTSSPAAPEPRHDAGPARVEAARCEDASGDSARTLSALHRAGT